ncbi:MAG: Crp/Fnr family transcriptional regulator [Sphingomonas sp.]
MAFGNSPPVAPRSPLQGLLRRLRLHARISDGDADALLQLPVEIVQRRQNTHIVREGDETSYCSVLVSGFAHRYRINGEGDRQILAIYVPGDPLDLDHLYLPVADDTVQAIKDCVVARVRHAALWDLVRGRPTLSQAITCTLLVDASVFREWTLNVGRRDARTRIAHLLCEVAARLEMQGFHLNEVPLPLTQDHIADSTGLSVVHVNRTLKALHADGVIDRKGALVILPNPSRLREIADFDPRYLHVGEGPPER